MNYLDRINTELPINLATAYEIALKTPDVKILSKEPDVSNIVGSLDWDIYESEDIAIQKINGCEITCHAAWDGDKFGCWLISINDRWLLTGGQGIQLSSNCTTLFAERCAAMDEYFLRLVPLVKKHGHQGFVSIEVVFKDGTPVYSSIGFGVTLLLSNMIQQLYDFSSGMPITAEDLPRGFVGSMRIYAYPYMPDLNKELGDAIIDNEKEIYFWDRDSYVIYEKGRNITETWKAIYMKASALKKYGICYRTDGDIKARQTFYRLKKEKII